MGLFSFYSLSCSIILSLFHKVYGEGKSMRYLRYNQLYSQWKKVPLDLKKYREPVTSKKFGQWITQLKNEYSQLQVTALAETLCGNEIIELRIGKGPIHLHINAGMHANESINTNLLLAFLARYLCILYDKAYVDLKIFLSYFTLSVVPMVNPDGIDLLHSPKTLPNFFYQNALCINQNSTDFSNWKANIRGVDINNQFPALWEKIFQISFKKNQPSPRDYPGVAPLTEKEALALYHLVQKNNFQSVLCLHTQGEEFYWGFQSCEPVISKVQAEILEAISGYKSVQTIKSYGGFKDWFILKYKKPGFTVEVGLGENPLPLSCFDSCLKKVDEILFSYLFLYV